MDLSRVKTWIAGDLLTSSDLNAEFNNIIDHNFDNADLAADPKIKLIRFENGIDGDILYFDSVWKRMAKSDNGKFLFMADGLPKWATRSVTELDYMEYATPEAAQAAYVTSVDTLQDFIGYTETDPGGDLTVAVNRITAVNYNANDVGYVYKDFGVDYFDALTIKFQGQIENTSNEGCSGGVWLSTALGEGGDVATNLGIYLNREAGGYRAILIRGNYVAYDLTDYILSAGTPYYFLLERAAGNDTVTIKIYDDAEMTSEVDTLTLAGFSTTKWRYLYGINHTHQGGAIPFSGYIQTNTILNTFSEDIIIQQGTYSLKVEAAKTDSLNETLTRTVDPTIDLSGKKKIIFWAYASRTGSNFKIGFHDSGGNTIEHTINIASPDTWEKQTVDISAVTDANKDAIDWIKITILNADSDNTFYIDNVLGFVIS